MDAPHDPEERERLIARLELENAQLSDRLTRLRPALHGLTEDLMRARRETAEWRRRYHDLAAEVGGKRGDGELAPTGHGTVAALRRLAPR